MVRITLAIDEDGAPYVHHTKGIGKKYRDHVTCGLDPYLRIEFTATLGMIPVYDGPSMGRNVIFLTEVRQ